MWPVSRVLKSFSDPYILCHKREVIRFHNQICLSKDCIFLYRSNVILCKGTVTTMTEYISKSSKEPILKDFISPVMSYSLQLGLIFWRNVWRCVLSIFLNIIIRLNCLQGPFVIVLSKICQRNSCLDFCWRCPIPLMTFFPRLSEMLWEFLGRKKMEKLLIFASSIWSEF